MLEISNISKSFGDKTILHDISFQVSDGEVIALLGPSGCGKTTLLRIVAGLERQDGGEVQFDGRDLTSVPVHRRGFGMVFQDYALFPHKTAAQNVAFGLKMAGWEGDKQAARVAELLEMVGLAGMGGRAIYDLSGGEQQRVALARALAPAPRLLLLDEPLGALDRALRERLMVELRTILRRASTAAGHGSAVTAIYVTHDQEEAFAVADRIMVMNQGRIEQAGPPLALYRSPETPFVARFLGMENFLAGEAVGQRPCVVETRIGSIRLEEECAAETGSQGQLLIRPEAAELLAEGERAENMVSGQIVETSFRGRYQIAQIAVTAGEETVDLKFSFEMERPLPPPGSQVQLGLSPGKCRFFG